MIAAPMTAVRVLIADDNEPVAKTIAELVQSYNHEVVGIASSGMEAVRLYQECSPDVVLMDFMMSSLNGAAASRIILNGCPTAKIVMLSGYMTDFRSVQHGGQIIGLQKPLPTGRLKQVLNSIENDLIDESRTHA